MIVPDFGAFISNERPVYISETEGKIYPASKRLAFNPSLSFNDGLLINSISFFEKISYYEAAELVKSGLDQWKKRLSARESLLLVGIGQLRINVDQKLIFTPLINNNFHPESFGLPELKIEPIVRKSPELSSIENEIGFRMVEDEEVVIESKNQYKPNKSRRVLYYSLTAYIPIIIGLWAVLFFVDPFNKSNESSLNPIEVKRNPIKLTTVKSENRNIEKLIRAKTKNIDCSDNTPPKTTVNVNETTESVYYIIGGSFKSYKNAAMLQKEFLSKNFKSEIIKSVNNKQYRVAYSKFTNRSEADSFLQSIRQSENSSAWILNGSK